MTSNLPVAAQRMAVLSRDEVLASFFQGLADPTRVRILRLGEAIVRDNADRLASCLVLAAESTEGVEA